MFKSFRNTRSQKAKQFKYLLTAALMYVLYIFKLPTKS